MCLIVKTGCCQFGLICCMCIHYPVSNYVADSVLKCLISYLNKLLLMHAWILSSELLLILLRQFLRHPPIHPMLQGGNRAKMRFGYNFWLGGPIDTRSMRLICILQDLFRDTPLVHIWPPWPNRIKAPGWWELHHLSSPIFVQHRHFQFPGWAVLFS